MVKRIAARVKRVEQLDIKSLLVQYANEFDVQQFVKIEKRPSPRTDQLMIGSLLRFLF